MKTAIKTFCVLTISTVSFATEPAAAPAVKAEATTKTSIAAPKHPVVTGKVVSVDAAAKTITVAVTAKDTYGVEKTTENKLNWNQQTKLMWQAAEGKTATAATLADLKAGAAITLKVSEITPGMASEIHIAPATTAAAETKPAIETKPATTTTTK